MTTKAKAVEDEAPAAPEPEAPEAAPEDDPTTIDEPPTDPEAKAPKGKSGEPARVSTNAWWCPVDDRSMPHDVTVCDGCGFKRK